MTVTILSNEDEQRLVDSLRAGDESAFEMLIDRYHAPLLRLAMLYVPSRAVAEDVVQETWLGVLQGLARFEGRSSLKTWIFRILTNRARTRGQREGRSIPFSAVWQPSNPTRPNRQSRLIASCRLSTRLPATGCHSRDNWDALPEERLIGQETRAQHSAGDRCAAGQPARSYYAT